MTEPKEPEEKVTSTVPKGMEVVTPVEGKLSTDQWQAFLSNLVSFALPLYLGFFTTQLALGVPVKTAALAALAALYSPLADYLKKRNSDESYLRDK